MKLPFKQIDRYIIKQFLGTYFFSIILILSISVVFDISEKLDDFLNPACTLRKIIFDYYLNFIPYYANLFSSLFVFISVIFFTSRLADRSEIIAMLSTGMSFKRILYPYVLSAGFIALLTFALNSYVIPRANKTRLDFYYTYLRPSRKVTDAKSIQLEVRPNEYVFIGSYSKENKDGQSFSMEKFHKKNLVSRLTADRIEYDTLNNWHLYNYTERIYNGLHEVQKTGAQIDTVIPMRPQDIVVMASDSETMTTPELGSYIETQKSRGAGSAKLFEIEYHKRFASIMSAFILTIIGASLSARKVKGGMGLNLVIGIGFCVSYILFMTVTNSFATSGSLPPFVAAWIPNVIFAVIAFLIYKKAPR